MGSACRYHGTLTVATALFLAMAAAGIPEADISARMRGFSGLVLMLLLGLSFTLIGGYVAGRTAGGLRYCTARSLRG